MLALFLGGLLSQRCAGHDSPDHEIVALTDRLGRSVQGGARAELLLRRATEHRALFQLEAAGRDLEEALRYDPGLVRARHDLVRVQLAQGETDLALATVNNFLQKISSAPDQAPLRMLRAEILSRKGDWQGALPDCEFAHAHIANPPLEWYLKLSEVQCRLGKFSDAVRGLKSGFERTGSAVLEVEYIDTMIEAGMNAKALQAIEPLLDSSRWQAAWLIRRARVRLGEADISRAHDDLLDAVAELNQRLGGAYRDPGLLVERGLAYACLGDKPLARRDLAACRRLGVETALLWRLELALAE
jgi:tetratricopeptide (TPR) repeat protein